MAPRRHWVCRFPGHWWEFPSKLEWEGLSVNLSHLLCDWVQFPIDNSHLGGRSSAPCSSADSLKCLAEALLQVLCGLWWYPILQQAPHPSASNHSNSRKLPSGAQVLLQLHTLNLSILFSSELSHVSKGWGFRFCNFSTTRLRKSTWVFLFSGLFSRVPSP